MAFPHRRGDHPSAAGSAVVVLLLVVISLIAASCGSGSADVRIDAAAEVSPSSTVPPTTTTSTTTTTTTTTIPAPTSTATTTTPTTTTPPTSTTVTTTTVTTTTVTTGAVYTTPGHVRFAVADGVELFHPAATVEMIGFHEAGHDGSKQHDVDDVVAHWRTLDTRGRGTGSRTAADIVVPPDAEIRSPVTGTVIRGGTYVLYCDHSDDFVVIEPDSRPGWEVKMFHFDGLQVAVGDRVEAGVTVIAPRATQLPFESQVDEFTAEPSNPHVHVEVIDPSIPDIPTPGGGC